MACSISMLARPMRTVSSSGTTDFLGTGHSDLGWHTISTSCPACCRPRANWSSTASVPPYAGAGTGSHGGAMIAICTMSPRLTMSPATTGSFRSASNEGPCGSPDLFGWRCRHRRTAERDRPRTIDPLSSSRARNVRAQRCTSLCRTAARIVLSRAARSAGGISIASSSACLMSSMSYGLTISAPSRSCAAPANSLRISAPSRSPRAATNSLATRFIPSASDVTTRASAARNHEAIPTSSSE